MKTYSVRIGVLGDVPLWAVIVGMLAVGNLVWLGWNAFRYADDRSAARQLKVVSVRTNGVHGTFVVEKESGKPIWAEWSERGVTKGFSYFFQGKSVMDIHLTPAGPPRRDVVFYGDDGKLEALWAYRGGGAEFSDRIFYDRTPPRLEVWYQGRWHGLDEQGGKRALVVGGQRFGLELTNGLWVPVPPDTGRE